MRIDPRYLTSFILLAVLTFACTPKTASKIDSPAPADVPLVLYADISPILERSCSPCHYPDQDGHKEPFDSYANARRNLATMISRVELPQSDEKFMPFKEKRQALTAEEIMMLKNWASGGYRQG
ncbi:MAG: hypothetical protein K9I85_06540 [Saprospiraceae bacterium]|nr:hypothetical protein [Saprospiraceae bacterium]